MSRSFGQAIIIENIAGAGGTVGAARVAKAESDGYTLLVGHMGYMAAAVGLYNKLPYDPVRDFEAIARFPDTPLVLIVGRTSGLNDIRGLIAQAKQSPGKINFGNAGVGSTGHLVAALFASAMRRIEREQSRIEFLECAPASRTAHLGAHNRDPVLGIKQVRCSAADLHRTLNQVARF